MLSSVKPVKYEIFPWNENFIVGIEPIDTQHKKLVSLLNKVIWQFVSSRDFEANTVAVNQLFAYARYHFHEEEQIWGRYFPNTGLARAHFETHKDFFSKLDKILKEVSEDILKSEELIGYLTNWLAVHILHSDRMMSTMVKLLDKGMDYESAERMAKQEIDQTPVLRSSIIDLYHKLSASAAQLIREKNARQVAEQQVLELLRKNAEQKLVEQAQEYQSHLEFLAYNDPQTGLLNRNGMMKKLREIMDADKCSQKPFALVSIDVDNFCQISAQLGAEGAERILGILARRWSDSLLPKGALAHLGSDDFVMIVRTTELLESQLNALYLSAGQPFHIDEWNGTIGFTAGIALYDPEGPHNGDDPEKLLRQADYALFQAKHDCRGGYRVFDHNEEQQRLKRLKQISELSQAIKDNQLVVYYQPKVNMMTGELYGVEALVRWQHPARGLLGPASFLPLVENHSVIVDLDEWVLRNVILQMLSWRKEGLDIKVSVNIDAYHMQRKDFCTRCFSLLDSFPDLDPSLLEFEILESTVISDISIVIDNVEKCRKRGISFSLDDFGKGYCSLSYLKRIPVNSLKIDQTFVRDMLKDASSIAILEGIIAIAKTFQLRVIAEGVEETSHGEILIQMGCFYGQGYSIAKPMPATELVNWKASWKTYAQWRTCHTLRRDDMLILTGLAELNAFVSMPESSEGTGLHACKSENIERWIELSLDRRPLSDESVVRRIENSYHELISIGNRIIGKGDNTSAPESTPADKQLRETSLSEYKNELNFLTDQIRSALDVRVSHRQERRTH